MQQDSPMDIPRVLIAALRGGSGKTILSVGIIAALSNQGKTVAPYKKGPDYIDAGWLALAGGRPCFNLDTFMADEPAVCRSFLQHSSDPNIDIAVIEGNRGLYDGLDVDGSTSSASLAKLLNTPVILCLDCTKSTRTMAAVVLGLLQFDPDVKIRGVILNQVAGIRHETLLRGSIEKYCHIPVIGSIPKLNSQYFPERHMGLIPTPEHEWAMESIRAAAEVVEAHVDIPALLEIAQSASWLTIDCALKGFSEQIPLNELNVTFEKPECRNKPKIGVIRDSAFQFYYPDNIEALKSAGADLVFISPLTDSRLPTIDALYIGGGFPETHADQLSKNLEFRNEIKLASEKGLPIYAECGGLMYLGESLVLDQSYPMAGVLPVVFGFSKKPQGHGYTIAEVVCDNPYYQNGAIIKGHEFHYSKVMQWKGNERDLAFRMIKGRGIHHQRDGFCYKNVFATYTHIHALGVKEWAARLVHLAADFAGSK
jgi:cobyrinic acid a,c-diamide synthase